MLIPVFNILIVLSLHDFLLGILAIPYFTIRLLLIRMHWIDPSAMANRKSAAIWQAVVPIIVPLFGEMLIIATLEGTMQINLKFLSPGEDQWQYGQILTLALALVQLADALTLWKEVRETEEIEFTDKQCKLESSFRPVSTFVSLIFFSSPVPKKAFLPLTTVLWGFPKLLSDLVHEV